MSTTQRSRVVAAVLVALVGETAMAQAAASPVARIADLQIDPARVDELEAAARENATATVRDEPGALAMHAAIEKGTPGRVRVFELYADDGAYQAHLQSPHFQKFRSATAKLVRSRAVFETVTVRLGAKPRLPAQALVRIAELEIDPAQLAAYQAAVTEEIDASIRVEPGVLAIYSVALKEHPTQLRFFEIYADEAAYRQHIASPHFKKYAEVTRAMITSRRLFETETLTLNAKPK